MIFSTTVCINVQPNLKKKVSTKMFSFYWLLKVLKFCVFCQAKTEASTLLLLRSTYSKEIFSQNYDILLGYYFSFLVFGYYTILFFTRGMLKHETNKKLTKKKHNSNLVLSKKKTSTRRHRAWICLPLASWPMKTINCCIEMDMRHKRVWKKITKNGSTK